MPWYAITNVGIGKSIQWKTHDMNISLHCDNLLDIDYQSVAWQPMPGRYFELSLKYKFIKK
jgi:outer membrane cobalamin receptor